MEVISHTKDNLGLDQTLFGTYTLNIKKTKITNKRQFILSQFVEEINKEREGTKWKPIHPRAVAIKTHHLKIPDLESFFSICMDYKHKKGSFSKCFWGCLKVDK